MGWEAPFVFTIDGAEYSVDQIDEELVFAVTTRFVGVPLDQFDLWDLRMEQFAAPARPVEDRRWWRRVFRG